MEQAPSLIKAADQARPAAVDPGAAIRWTRHCARLVAVCLELLRSLYPDRVATVEPTLAAIGVALGTQAVLVCLRSVAAAQLGDLPAPLGFRPPRRKAVAAKKSSVQHKTGLDPPADVGHGGGKRHSAAPNREEKP